MHSNEVKKEEVKLHDYRPTVPQRTDPNYATISHNALNVILKLLRRPCIYRVGIETVRVFDAIQLLCCRRLWHDVSSVCLSVCHGCIVAKRKVVDGNFLHEYLALFLKPKLAKF